MRGTFAKGTHVYEERKLVPAGHLHSLPIRAVVDTKPCIIDRMRERQLLGYRKCVYHLAYLLQEKVRIGGTERSTVDRSAACFFLHTSH